MNSGAHVLIVSRDQMLLQTRKLILGAIFQVDAAGRVPEAEQMMANCTFDLIVLCYSLADEEYAKVVDLAQRQDPRPKILTLRSAGNHHVRDGADQEFMVENGPYALMKKTAEMLELQLKGVGRLAQT
jgi:DNA-binding NarL/FixJ family response regulator